MWICIDVLLILRGNIMDFMNLLSGLMGAAPKAGPSARSLAKEPAGTQNPEAPTSPTAVLTNQEHNSTAVAMAAVKPETASPIDSNIVEAKAHLPKVLGILDSVLKTFGISLKDFTQFLLQKQPEVTQKLVEEALKAIVPQQQAAVQAPVTLVATTEAANKPDDQLVPAIAA
jgi:hypothetical protein